MLTKFNNGKENWPIMKEFVNKDVPERGDQSVNLVVWDNDPLSTLKA